VVSEFLWIAAITAIKLSILHLYLTIIPGLVFRRITYTIALIIIMFGITATLTKALVCRPISLYWAYNTLDICPQQWSPEVVQSAVNAVIDIVIHVLPLPVFWKLKLPKRKKIGLMVVFGIGLS
jgi:hypothetical protein